VKGLELKIARVTANVTQAKVAALLGVSQAVLCAIETGRRPVTGSECAAILKAIDLAAKGGGVAVVPLTGKRRSFEDN